VYNGTTIKKDLFRKIQKRTGLIKTIENIKITIVVIDAVRAVRAANAVIVVVNQIF